jgi:hypothetical protein
MNASREQVVLATRAILDGIALWTSYIFDEGACRRLLGPAAARVELQLWSPLESLDRLAGISNAAPGADIVRVVERLHDFAWEGTWRGDESSLIDAEHEIEPLLRVLNVDFVAASGEPLTSRDMEGIDARAIVTSTITAAIARRELNDGEPITFEQLATLARVSDKTVRTAASRTTQSLRIEKGPANRTYIPADSAIAWLKDRKDFRETRFHAQSESEFSFSSAEKLGDFLRRKREAAGLSHAELVRRLRWRHSSAVREYEFLELGKPDAASGPCSAAGLKALATALEIAPITEFVIEASRVILYSAAARELSVRTFKLRNQKES